MKISVPKGGGAEFQLLEGHYGFWEFGGFESKEKQFLIRMKSSSEAIGDVKMRFRCNCQS